MAKKWLKAFQTNYFITKSTAMKVYCEYSFIQKPKRKIDNRRAKILRSILQGAKSVCSSNLFRSETNNHIEKFQQAMQLKIF